MRKLFLVSVALILVLILFSTYQYLKFSDGKLHIIFCNVGQGDGIFIRSPKGLDIMVDSGPDDSILNCLSSHMPFWDRNIELAFLTHPHEDHMRGFISVFERYNIQNFATENLSNDTVLYREVWKKIQNSKIKSQKLYARDKFKLSDGLELKILGPSKEFLQRTSPTGVIAESEGFGNLITLISYGKFKALLTGDSQIEGLREAGLESFLADVLQVPHHGSRFGLDSDLVQKLIPRLAVISVGKNKYGHPSKEVIGMLKDLDIKFLTTKEHGDVEIIVENNGIFKVQ